MEDSLKGYRSIWLAGVFSGPRAPLSQGSVGLCPLPPFAPHSFQLLLQNDSTNARQRRWPGPLYEQWATETQAKQGSKKRRPFSGRRKHCMYLVYLSISQRWGRSGLVSNSPISLKILRFYILSC
jgi:hypothetical protein